MAIEITNFNYPTDPNNNINEVHDWLVANASELFPGGIVKDASNMLIRCYPIEGDDQTQMAIPFYNSKSSFTGYVKARYDTTIYALNPNAMQYGSNAYRRAAKTSNGIAIMAHHSGAVLFVSRTTSGHVCVCASGSPTHNATQFYLVLSDLENKSFGSPNVMSNLPALVNSYRLRTEADHTTLVPIVFDGGDYTENLCMTPFTQAIFNANLQEVNIDGQEYVYDGLFALKG